MRFQTRSRHVIDIIFPIALFFVFAASSLAVLVLAANLYHSTTDRISANDTSRTSLSYLSEKIRQNDRNGGIAMVRMDGTDCLALETKRDGELYITYIYEIDGMLKELFIKDGASVSLNGGKHILEIGSLSMKELEDGLFQFVLTDKNGHTSSQIISERSAP